MAFGVEAVKTAEASRIRSTQHGQNENRRSNRLPSDLDC